MFMNCGWTLSFSSCWGFIVQEARTVLSGLPFVLFNKQAQVHVNLNNTKTQAKRITSHEAARDFSILFAGGILRMLYCWLPLNRNFMSEINPYNLLNERERLINEIRQSHTSTTILSYAEKKRRDDITAENIARLVNNGKSVVGQNFSGSGKIQSKSSKTIVVEQKNQITTYDYSGKSTKKDCTIAIQFPNESNFGSFIAGDKVYFTGRILKLNVETSSQYSYSFGYSGNSYDIVLENISFQKQSNSDGHCFIATAVYQDYDAPVVRELRKFRDLHLLNNYPGRLFVNFYYRYSPRLAKTIHGSRVLSHCAKYFIVMPAYLLAKIMRILK
jgi:hypothetical protein